MPLKYEDLKRAKREFDKVGKYLAPVPYVLKETKAGKAALKEMRRGVNRRLGAIGKSLPTPTGGPAPDIIDAKYWRQADARKRRRDARREDKHLAQPGMVPGYTEPGFGWYGDPLFWRREWERTGTPRRDWTRLPGKFGAQAEMDWRRYGLARQTGFPDPTGRSALPQAVARSHPNFRAVDEDRNPYRGKGTDLRQIWAPSYVAKLPSTGNFGYISDEDWMRKSATLQQKQTYEKSMQQRLKRLAAAKLSKRTK